MPRSPILTDSDIIAPADDLLATEFDHEVVILNLRDGVYYGLDYVGARVWALLRDPCTLASIQAAINSEYEVGPGRCAADVRELIGELASRDLVTVRRSR